SATVSPAAPAAFAAPAALVAISGFYLLRMPDTLIILRSQQLGIPVAVVPLLWAAVHVVRSSSSLLGGAATDRLGPARPRGGGWGAGGGLPGGWGRGGRGGDACVHRERDAGRAAGARQRGALPTSQGGK